MYITFSPWFSAIDPSLVDFTGHLTYVLAGSCHSGYGACFLSDFPPQRR